MDDAVDYLNILADVLKDRFEVYTATGVQEAIVL